MRRGTQEEHHVVGNTNRKYDSALAASPVTKVICVRFRRSDASMRRRDFGLVAPCRRFRKLVWRMLCAGRRKLQRIGEWWIQLQESNQLLAASS